VFYFTASFAVTLTPKTFGAVVLPSAAGQLLEVSLGQQKLPSVISLFGIM
jgi:hypothetical protein